jgi:hypothetical protein
MKTARLHCNDMDFSWEGALVEYDPEQTLIPMPDGPWVYVCFSEAIGAYSLGEVISVPLRYLKEET